MNLTKEQALDLVKILAHYQTLTSNVCAPTSHATLGELERFLIDEESDDCCDSSEGDEDEEVEDDYEAEEESADEEDEEESEESDKEEDDEDSEDPEDDEDDGEPDEGEPAVDSWARGSDLHDLKVAKGVVISSSVGEPDDAVTLEFENTEGDDADVCDLLVDGQPIGPITLVRRKGTELHVAEGASDDRTWHSFSVSKFPKGWAQALPVDDLVEVE